MSYFFAFVLLWSWPAPSAQQASLALASAAGLVAQQALQSPFFFREAQEARLRVATAAARERIRIMLVMSSCWLFWMCLPNRTVKQAQNETLREPQLFQLVDRNCPE